MAERGTVEIMTVSLSRTMARQARRNGYFRAPEGQQAGHWDDAYVRCPLCQGDVILNPRPFARRYKEPSAPEWDATYLKHWTASDEDEIRCPAVVSVAPRAVWKD